MPSPEVLDAYGFGHAVLTPVTSGHINVTYFVQRGEQRWVLQRLHPIFGAEVCSDIEAVTLHLADAGVPTPRLVRTHFGALFIRDRDGGIWRALSYVEGVTHDRAESPRLCAEAGILVGRFHAALASFARPFGHQRAGVHDTARHLARLRDAMDSQRAHSCYAEVAPLAREILERTTGLRSFANLPLRVVHGDLKLTNIVFTSAGDALALIDLDTVARMPLPLELGDAWRSWCNPHGEDNPACRFELDYLHAAVDGYGRHTRGLLTAAEREALPAAIYLIALELAARFATDALEERYFGWDKERFARASEHNVVRAQSQLQLARSIGDQEQEIVALTRRLV